MTEITQLLAQVRSGDPHALDAVFDQLYPELRRLALAQIRSGQRTLTPTVLVHEAYLRLLGAAQLELNDRRHFMACAARAMRAVLIDHLRRASANKRGGPDQDLRLSEVEGSGSAFPGELLALDRALDDLDEVSPRQREIIELHFFAGLTFAQIGELLGCHERTAKREWERGRAFLYAQMS